MSIDSLPDRDAWVDRLVALFRGRITPEQLLSAAATDAERCEAHYYIRMHDLLTGRTDDARKVFEAGLKLNCIEVMEFDFARAQLAQLDKQLASKARP